MFRLSSHRKSQARVGQNQFLPDILRQVSEFKIDPRSRSQRENWREWKDLKGFVSGIFELHCQSLIGTSSHIFFRLQGVSPSHPQQIHVKYEITPPFVVVQGKLL